jgi:hypothetical protein
MARSDAGLASVALEVESLGRRAFSVLVDAGLDKNRWERVIPLSARPGRPKRAQAPSNPNRH